MFQNIQHTTYISQFISFLDSKNKILLVTHENPDGDGIGAMLGLAHYLLSMQKKIRIVVTPGLPINLAFIDSHNWIEVFDQKTTHKELATWPDAIILIDAHSTKRMGSLHSIFEASKADKACLDHHLKDIDKTTSKEFNCELIDPSASASAELVFELVTQKMPLPLPQSMAEAIYVGIADDTGNFKFSNATAKAHRIAANLIEQGIDPAKIYQNLYNQGRLEKLKIFSQAFDGMIALGNNRAIRLTVTKGDLAACGANYSDLNGLVNYPIEIRGVEVSCLLYELPNGQTKASLRSRGKVDVHAICQRFGGGGHKLASGMKLNSHISEVQSDIDAAILAQLEIDK